MNDKALKTEELKGAWAIAYHLIENPRLILMAGIQIFLLILVITITCCGAILAISKYYSLAPATYINAYLKTPKAGLIDFRAKSQELDTYKWEHLTSAKKEIFFIGVAMHLTLSQDHERDILDGVNKGVNYKFLVADPCGSHFKSNAAMFNGAIGDHLDHAKITIQTYFRIANQIASLKIKPPGSIELKTLDAPIPLAAYFFDPTEKDGSVEIVTRLPNSGAPQMPGLVFGKVADGLLDAYYAEWSKVWSNSTPTSPNTRFKCLDA
jgi:hypothetical protein